MKIRNCTAVISCYDDVTVCAVTSEFVMTTIEKLRNIIIRPRSRHDYRYL